MSTQLQAGARPVSARRYAATKTVAVLTALVLIAALTVPAIGIQSRVARADHGSLQAVFGTVVAVNAPVSLTVATDSGVQTVVIPGNHVFTGDIGAVEDISEGDRVVGSVHVDEDGIITADRLLILPDLTVTVTRHILGVILEIQDGSIVVQDRDGNTISIDVPAGLNIPSVGTVVTAVAQLDRATGILRAQAFDRVEDAVQRIQDAKDRVTDEDLKEELEDRLEQARINHLSALERAREGLERAQQAVSAAIAEREEAERRLAEVQSRFDDLRQRYVQEANDRNERLPELRTEGTLRYEAEEWAKDSGTFQLSPRISSVDDDIVRDFTWTQDTLAIVPVEVRESDPKTPAITSTVARSIALPLNDVKSLIPSGSQVIVQYDPNSDPAIATLITVLPPELPDAIESVLESERLRSISGFITLVEETPDLAATGVIVVTNREHEVRVAAKVNEDTGIVVDGEPARFDQLAAGMSVDVEFDSASTDQASGSSAALTGRLDALRIRAVSEIDDDEVHIAGVIAGVEPDPGIVGILTRDGDVIRAQVLDDAVIIKDGSAGRFGTIESGDLVLDSTRLNRSTLELTRLVLQSPSSVTFTGAITGLDRNPNRMTVATANGRVLVVYVTDSTELRTEDGGSLTFSDLMVSNRIIKGAALPVQRGGETLLIGGQIVIGGPAVSTGRGVVRRVDVDSGEIRIVTSRDSNIDLVVGENNRSIMFKNEVRIRDLSTVETGDIVESVSYVTANGTIIRMSVVSPNLQRTRGIVTSVGDDALTIETTNGFNVALAVSDRTELTLNGRLIQSLDLVRRGDSVVEAVYISNPEVPARGDALRIRLIRSAAIPDGGNATVESTISGVIEEISDEAWNIAGRRFRVTSKTRFFGETPQIGLVAKATLVLSSNGQFTATAISVAGRPDTNPSTRPVEVQPVEPGDTPDLVRILGRVQTLNVDEDGKLATLAIDGVKINVLTSTVVAGEPEVGVRALVIVRRTPGGSVVANSIVFVNSVTVPATGSVLDPEAEPAETGSNDAEPDDTNSPGEEPGPEPDRDDPNLPVDEVTGAVGSVAGT